MATLEEGLVAKLLAMAGVTSLVGTRIYPLVEPQDASLPAIVYQRISGPRDHVMEGASGLAMARMQLTMLASTYSGAKALAEAVRAALDGVGHATWGTVPVERSFLENDSDAWADRFEAPVVRHDYSIWYRE